MKIKFKRINDNVKIPTKGSKFAAGWDIYSYISEPIYIKPRQMKMIPTGLYIQPPKNHFAAIFARSGLATKQGLRPANCVGVCDEDYRGEYLVALYNDSEQVQTIEPNMRIAQVVFIKYSCKKWKEVKDLKKTIRHEGGFGSTGNK